MSRTATVQPIQTVVWEDKYQYNNETSIQDTFKRMITGVCGEESEEYKVEAFKALEDRRMIPAGRIHSGAGTDKRVTLINCFVSDTIQDSLTTIEDEPGLGIMDALAAASYTQQMGGGIGMDFSTIRPAGALVKRTASVSSGVLHFMDMWHAMCQTIMSSGTRRGAMMGTLRIDHPDIIGFIKAKQTKGRMSNFNVSALLTKDFMAAMKAGKDWDLLFHVPRADGEHVASYEVDGVTQYVYQRLPAQDLWNTLMEATYIHAEPGCIFIDRVNEMNNLSYCEQIAATNPCGEQPLPPNGDCNLGHINLAVMVIDPFGPNAEFDFPLLRKTIRTMTRFQDDVIDASMYPTPAQKIEAETKRRLGMGYTGLANALQQLKMAYGSLPAVEMTRRITMEMALAAYDASVDLAIERGSFPAYDAEAFLKSPYVSKLPTALRDRIKKHGIRNGVLLTLAPVGTVSVVAGNLSSGIEPVFAFEYQRKYRQFTREGEESYLDFTVYDYGYLLYHQILGVEPGSVELPTYMNSAQTLTVDEHLNMQAAAQEWIDSSISKTLNCDESMSFEDFKDIYERADDLGLKGCTTYRPDPRSERGVILTTEKAKPTHQEKIPMQEVLEGRRYRLKWPGSDSAMYLAINDYVDEEGQRRPFEIFINSKGTQHDEWITSLTLMITGIFRRGGDVTFISEELKQVISSAGGAWINGDYVASQAALIGATIEKHFAHLGLITSPSEPASSDESQPIQTGGICPSCSAPTLVRKEGCKECTSCGYSACG